METFFLNMSAKKQITSVIYGRERKCLSFSWLETKKLTEVNVKTEYSIVEEGISNLGDYACFISKIIF